MDVRQVTNTLELFEWFAERGAPATLSEIASALCWPRSSTFNLIGTLSRRGYLYEPRSKGSYYPTSRWLNMAQDIAAGDPLPPELEARAARLRDASGETVAIAAPAGTSAIYMFVAQSRSLVRYSTASGHRVPLHATSSGRALLSQFSQGERQALYRKMEFTKYGSATPVDAAEVELKLSAEVNRGFHVSNDEHSEDLLGVAVAFPFFDRRLAVTIGGPRERCLRRLDDFADLLLDAKRLFSLKATPPASARPAAATAV